MRFVMSYSFGKDSALALYRMINAGHTPVALLTTFNRAAGRSWVHGIGPDLMQATAQSLGLPLLMADCSFENYAEGFEKGLAEAKALGAEGCAFGDIDLEGHREYNEARCKAQGLACLLPLWQGSRAGLVAECIDSGFKAMIKTIQTGILPDTMLGQPLTHALAQSIAATGADICGENGEYHTFVYDGPLFSAPVPLTTHGIVDLGQNKAVDIRLAT